MRASVLCGVVPVLALAAPHRLATTPPAEATCRVVVVEGEVRAGQQFRSPALAGAEVELQPNASGWVLRIVPTGHPGEDRAEMATPPYRSVTPLAVSTDWSFRAQDAVGWNPRRFRFAADEATFAQLRSLREAVEAGQAGQTGALAELASRQPEGVLEILDAHLVPGTADQTRAASMVAGHFAETAHALEQPAAGRPTPLGTLTWIRFRVSLALPPGQHAATGSRIERARACGGR